MTNNDETLDGLPVAGYRKQSAYSVSVVNGLKSLEAGTLMALDAIDQDDELDADKRWLSIARTHIEQGFMAANRSVFKPSRLTPGEALRLLATPEEQTEAQRRRDRTVTAFLASLTWSDDTPEEVKLAVAGNVRGFMAFLADKGV